MANTEQALTSIRAACAEAATPVAVSELHQLREQNTALVKVWDAVANLIKQKGRHNTEIAYQRLVAAYDEVRTDAAPQASQPVEQPTGFDAEFLSKRLARVAKLVGVPMPDFSHEGTCEVAGTILGQIASKIEQDSQPVSGAGMTTWQEICEQAPGVVYDGRKGLIIYEPDLQTIGGLLSASGQAVSEKADDADYDAGIEAAAKWVDQRREAFMREHGYLDPSTGAWEYGTGRHAEAKLEYETELVEIAEGLRALSSTPAQQTEGDK